MQQLVTHHQQALLSEKIIASVHHGLKEGVGGLGVNDIDMKARFRKYFLEQFWRQQANCLVYRIRQ
jgi:hypothetical protein